MKGFIHLFWVVSLENSSEALDAFELDDVISSPNETIVEI